MYVCRVSDRTRPRSCVLPGTPRCSEHIDAIPRSPAWHRKLRSLRSKARKAVHRARGEGVRPPRRALSRLASHHTRPAYRELRQMGRKEQWEQRPGKSYGKGYGGWPSAQPSSWSKGGGKWRGNGQWKQDRHKEEPETPLFPSFEMMSSSSKDEHKPNPSNGRRSEDMQVDEWSLEPGEYARNIQKTLNFFRKAEGRCRRIEEEKKGLDQKWENFQVELRQAYIKERSKYHEKMAKLQNEADETMQAKDEALKELKEAFAPTARAKIPKDKNNEAEAVEELAQLLQNPDGDDEGGLAKVLLEAMHHGGLEDEDNRREIRTRPLLCGHRAGGALLTLPPPHLR